jgi:hypothetical protein
MAKIKLDIDTLEKYIHYSLKIAQNDAPLAGVFCCSVIELLGRFLRIHTITISKDRRVHFPGDKWFYDFIEKYLKNRSEKYFEQRLVLWKLLRCESAHAVLATTAITWSNADWIKLHHLTGHNDPRANRKSLLIWTSRFVQDVDDAVSNFFIDVKKDKSLENNCQKSFLEMYNYGQNIIKKEIGRKVLKIESEGEISIG